MRRIVFSLTFVFLLSLISLASSANTTTWRASYYSNAWFGPPISVERSEASINYDWGTGSPTAGIPADQFSVRWAGSLQSGANQTWRFSVTTADSVRVFVDGQRIINAWAGEARNGLSVDQTLSAGVHYVRVEYADQSGPAAIRYSHAPAGQASGPAPAAGPALPNVTARLVKDINAGNRNSNPVDFTELNGVAYFNADNGVNGRELFRSDGSPAGTFLVSDINPGAGGGNGPMLHGVAGNQLLFVQDHFGYHLSNGTRQGTVSADYIDVPWYQKVDPVVMNNTIYFFKLVPKVDDKGNSLGNAWELWRSNGSAASTRLVKELGPEAWGYPGPFSATAVGNQLFFYAHDGQHGVELWRSDGTPNGTFMVKDIRVGTAWSIDTWSGNEMVNVNGTLYFWADNGINGRELWRSNGSAAGTFMVKDIVPGGGSSWPSGLTAAGNSLFFTATDARHAIELWRSDGTAKGTYMVKDINTRGSAFDYGKVDMVAAGGAVYFAATDSEHGREVWYSDGSAVNTRMVSDLTKGRSDSWIGAMEVANGRLFFVANGKLYQTNGFGVQSVPVSGANTLNVRDLAFIGNKLFITANDGNRGFELWVANP